MPRPESLAEVFAQLFAADPGRARRIVEEHQLDAAGRCRACEVRGCTLRAWALDALARRGEVGEGSAPRGLSPTGEPVDVAGGVLPGLGQRITQLILSIG